MGIFTAVWVGCTGSTRLVAGSLAVDSMAPVRYPKTETENRHGRLSRPSAVNTGGSRGLLLAL